MKYKVNKDFIIQNAGDQILVYDQGRSILYTLNETAAFIFNGIKRSWSEEEIKEKIADSFEITRNNIKNDFTSCIKDLLKSEIIVDRAKKREK